MRLRATLLGLICALCLLAPGGPARANCMHLGDKVTCPVGVPPGSTSLFFLPDGGIQWNSGVQSFGPCCAAPSGTDTGRGILNLGNELGGAVPGTQRDGATGARRPGLAVARSLVHFLVRGRRLRGVSGPVSRRGKVRRVGKRLVLPPRGEPVVALDPSSPGEAALANAGTNPLLGATVAKGPDGRPRVVLHGFILPHVLEKSGTITATQNTFDSTLFTTYGTGVASGTIPATPSVDLYLFDQSTGAPMTSATGREICTPCNLPVAELGTKSTVRIDDLIQDAGGFEVTHDREARLCRHGRERPRPGRGEPARVRPEHPHRAVRRLGVRVYAPTGRAAVARSAGRS